MSVDTERVVNGVQIMHEIWASFVSIVLAAVLLYYQASWAMFAPRALLLSSRILP
jgi:ATP-binding cassette subfamily C (CFTR/MRP) protein 1